MPDSQVNEQFRHSELTKQIIGVFYEVYNELGHGFIESVYENSMVIALRAHRMEVLQQIDVPVLFRGKASVHFALTYSSIDQCFSSSKLPDR
jgi:hypothetical protein